jgi:signal transduction histidine kinase
MEAKNEFLSLTTHELRTPLTAIKGYLSMIIQGDAGEITPRQQLFFGKAMDATNRLVGLVEEILSVIRIEENRVTLHWQEFSLTDLISECVQEFRLPAEQKKITINYRSTPLSIWGDRVKTKQVLANLIENAIKYTRDKGTVDISYTKRRQNACISIRDTGVGIAPKHVATIFDKFVRIDNPLSVKAGGTGLGLYIVKNLVEKQGGRIWVESIPKKGTTFSLLMPLEPPKGIVPNQPSQERSFA